MTTPEDSAEEEETRLSALDAARRAVQFLESGQATGCFILLTDSDRAIMWDTHLTPSPHPIGDAANVMSEYGRRMRQVWHELVTEGDGRGFLTTIKNEE